MTFRLLIIILILINNSTASDQSGCAAYFVDGVLNFDTNIYKATEIQDTSSIYVEFFFNETISIYGTPSGIGGDFIEAVVRNNRLIFRSYYDFTYIIDRFTPKQVSSIHRLTLSLQLQCNPALGLTPFMFVQDVRDTNNYAPSFKKSTYEYTLPMPLAPRFDLTSLGDSIIATDLDFSNQHVTFTISNDWILETDKVADSKNYRAILRVSEYTTLLSETSLTITATDSGTPYFSANATIIIKIDKNHSLPICYKLLATVDATE